MPGVLLTEAIAQVGGIALLYPEGKSWSYSYVYRY